MEALVDELYSADFTIHDNVQPGAEVGRAGVKQFVRDTLRNTPDIHIAVEEIVAVGDTAAGRFTVTGTEAATGNRTLLLVMEFYRFAAGRLAEVWQLAVPSVDAPAAVPAPVSANANPQLEKLVGSWSVAATMAEQNATFPCLLTFIRDGIVVADEPPLPFETTAHGAWVSTGPDTAAYTFVGLVGGTEGKLTARITVAGKLRLDPGTEGWRGPCRVQVVDASGNETFADRGTFEATRIAVKAID